MTVSVPAVEPAVAGTEACPFDPVGTTTDWAPEDDKLPEPPVMANCTGTPETGPLADDAMTDSGVPKAIPCGADWLLPETVVKLESGGVTAVTVIEKD